LFKKLLLERVCQEFSLIYIKNRLLEDDEMEIFVVFYFSWLLIEFISREGEIVDVGWVWGFWVEGVPEDEPSPVFDAVLYSFKAVSAYQTVDPHGWMFVSF
jgi:hypothetical protein